MVCVPAPAPRTDTTAMASASNQTATACVLALRSATATMTAEARQSWMSVMSAAAQGIYVFELFHSIRYYSVDTDVFQKSTDKQYNPLLFSISLVPKMVSTVLANAFSMKMYVGYAEERHLTTVRVP